MKKIGISTRLKEKLRAGVAIGVYDILHINTGGQKLVLVGAADNVANTDLGFKPADILSLTGIMGIAKGVDIEFAALRKKIGCDLVAWPGRSRIGL